MKKILFILALAIAGSCGVSAQNQNNKVVVSDKTGWHEIGEVFVDFKTDRDEITVMGADRFASLQFKVTEAPIHLMDFEVWYEDGTSQKYDVNMLIAENSSSNIIDLKGKESTIKKVVFVYHTVDTNKDNHKAHVELWGMKTNAVKK